LSGTPHQLVRIDVTDENGNSKTLYRGKLDETGQLKKEIEAYQLKRGTYLLSVKFTDKPSPGDSW